jgi:acetyl-CoA carboxylase biotin carboxyl carrier protein
MDLSQIQALIKFVSKSGVSEVELETKDFKINIKADGKNGGDAPQMMAMPAQAYVPQPMMTQQQPAPLAAPAHTSEATAPKAAENSHYITVKSPMIGTFYRAANPETPSFANIGDEIAPGKVICIIEAMKLFNEIESEVSGKIVKVLVDDATPVEYDQPLFLVDPS